MQIKDQLKNLLGAQKDFLHEFESVVKEFESNDLVNQNIQLNRELQEYKKLVEEFKVKVQSIEKENQGLRIALKEQILDEKLNILKISRQKLETYFHDLSRQYNNRLLALEQSTMARCQELKNIAAKELGNEKEDLNKEIEKLYSSLKEKIQQRKAQLDSLKDNALKDIETEINQIGNEAIDEELIQKRIRQNDIEIKIGLSWVNKIGIFLILIGVATAMKYTYSNYFNNYMKGIFAFVIGLIFLGGGEWFSRKAKSVVAQGLTGGGIAILYLATFSSYFVLKIIGLEAGLLLSVLITAAALALSVWYSSKTICSFALIGGYIPFFAYLVNFKMDDFGFYVSMGYFFLLNLLTLLISFNKRWTIVNYISFLFNVPTLIYLVFKVSSVWVGITYCIVTFSMYLVITLAYPLRNKLRLHPMDMILLGLNTFISCITVYMLFEQAKLSSVRGLLAIVFCLIYFGLGQFLEKTMEGEKQTQVLFYLISLTFAVLIIPFQFGVQWLTLGWLAEGVFMITYGLKGRFKYMERAGWAVFLLCVATFFILDYANTILPGILKVQYFDFKYTAVMLGLLFTLFIYLIDMSKDALKKYGSKAELIAVYKFFAVFNLWIYVTYMSNRLYNRWIVLDDYDSFYKTLLFALMTMMTAFAISKVKLLQDKAIKGLTIFLYLLGDLICIFLNLSEPVFIIGEKAIEIFSVIVLVLYNILVFFNIRDLLIAMIRRSNRNLEIYPLFMGIYLLGNITALLIVQFNLGEMNLLFSLLYLVFALIFIIYGFKKKYAMTRRLGLGLSILSTAKLFIYDLAFLKTEGKIASYFAFGLVLIGISFVYQRFKKVMEASSNSTGVGESN
ncbi:MAG: DUF2339 domain-containing protein [Clostridia bacterium]|nr:DUF2339 domain-containing protein [Clostridia bacterium]